MSKALDRINRLKSEFEKFEQWEDRYKHLIEIGKQLPEASASLHIEDNKIKGCQSQVWLAVKATPEKSLHFEADSDAVIVKGLVALLLNVYQDLTPQEILATPPTFLKELGLESHLSPSRANGLQAMAKQIQYYATAYQVLFSRT